MGLRRLTPWLCATLLIAIAWRAWRATAAPFERPVHRAARPYTRTRSNRYVDSIVTRPSSSAHTPWQGNRYVYRHGILARPSSRARTPWRGNRYVDRDGILPYQRCGANGSAIGPPPLHAQYTAANARYDLVILAASAWGQAHGAGEAPDLQVIELLAFDPKTSFA